MRGRTIGDLGEDQLIERIKRVIGPAPSGVVGIGDDAAVLGRQLLTTDTLVENVHFRRSWCSPEELGWKALAVNVSDITAMGGDPQAALVSLILPEDMLVDVVLRMYAGMRRFAQKFDVVIAGGNLVRGSQLSLTLTLAGEFRGKTPILRSGARSGDRLYLSGQPGLARLGYLILDREIRAKGNAWDEGNANLMRRRKQAADKYPGGLKAVRRFISPDPRIDLVRSVRPSAMMDVSDGLATDLSRLAKASGVGVVIDVAKLPVSRTFRALCEALKVSPQAVMLEGGEDYELIMTLPRSAEIPNAVAWHCIGEVTSGKQIMICDEKGRARPVSARGFDHFKQ